MENIQNLGCRPEHPERKNIWLELELRPKLSSSARISKQEAPAKAGREDGFETPAESGR